MKKYITLFIALTYLLISNIALACNIEPSHPTLYYYNKAEMVFVGKVVKMGDVNKDIMVWRDPTLNLKSFFIRFEVEKVYRGDKTKKQIDIAKMAIANVTYQKDGKYLVYASLHPKLGILQAGEGVNITDTLRMKKHLILNKIEKKPTQLITEHSQFDNKWAEGHLKNGIPVGKWKFYTISGELKEEGKYKKGHRCGKWKSYFVTNGKEYIKALRIVANKNRAYKLIEHKELKTGTYKYITTYQDRIYGGPTLSIKTIYQKRITKAITSFKDGLKHGKMQTFNPFRNGKEVLRYKKGVRHGKYWALNEYPDGDHVSKIKTIGEYVEGKHKEEYELIYSGRKLKGINWNQRDFKWVNNN